jgi:hypothetical protein
MKIIISENQLEKLKQQEIYKKLFFKYWDKNGPMIKDEMLKLFGVAQRGLDEKIHMSDIQRWLTEYLGIDKAKEIASEFLRTKEHTINNCGGYKFNFTINKFMYDDNQYEISLTVDDVNGSVTLMMVDNSEHNLKDAINNDDYGWEIENEIEDCIYDYLSSNIEETTGLSFVIDQLRYKSGKK